MLRFVLFELNYSMRRWFLKGASFLVAAFRVPGARLSAVSTGFWSRLQIRTSINWRPELRMLISACFLATMTSELGAATYYVATNGNDSWSGTAPAYTSGSDGPFASLHHGARAMLPGDILYVRGGLYNCTNISGQYFDPVSSSVTLSNYPGETPLFIDQQFYFKQQYFPELISIYSLTNVHIYGITSSNCQRNVTFSGATNCELAYCDLGYMDTNYLYAWIVGLAYNSCNNWVHDNVIHDHNGDLVFSPPYQHDSGSLLAVGTGLTNDLSSGNILERNLLYHAGHDCISLQADFNVAINNVMHNEPWIWWPEFQQFGGQRELLVESCHNLIESNWVGYSGLALDNGGSTGMEICFANCIIRHNISIWNQNYGFTIYGNKAPGYFTTNNHVYNNTLAWNGLGQVKYTNYIPNPNLGWTNGQAVEGGKSVLSLNYVTNCVFVNNIFAYNARDPGSYGSQTNCMEYGGGGPQYNFWGANWTNSSNGDPKFVNAVATNSLLPLDRNTPPGGITVMGNPWDSVSLNLHLRNGSPCIDAGQFLTAAVGAGTSSTSMTVADAAFFFAGAQAAQRVLPGDTIQLKGQTATSTITAINYIPSTNYNLGVLTLNSPLTWTNGQGVALAYNGLAPDMGAFESSYSRPPFRPTVFAGRTTSQVLTITPITGSAPLTVQFNNSTGWPGTVDFGDGATTSIASGTHSYTAPGTYTVKFSEAGGGGAGITYSDLVSVTNAP